MKSLLALALCVCGFTVMAQPIQRSTLTTNTVAAPVDDSVVLGSVGGIPTFTQIGTNPVVALTIITNNQFLTFINTNYFTNLFTTNLTVINQIKGAKGQLTGLTPAGIVSNDASGNIYTTAAIANNSLANSSITIQGSAVSLGGTTLAIGSTPTFNLAISTNLPPEGIIAFTNAVVGGNNVDFSVRAATTNMTGSITWTGFINNNTTNYNWAIRHCVNTSGGNLTVGGGTGWRLDVGAGNSYTVTNGTARDFWIEQQTGQFTNMFSVTAY